METELDGKIREAGWYQGTERSWAALDSGAQEAIAFKATGCLVAYPTWTRPVDCLHIDCRIARGEKPPIAKTHQMLRAERACGYLRWLDREQLAVVYRSFRKLAHERGEYDIWKLDYKTLVRCALA